MKCVILAAGYATRLYPLTENFPKPLLKIGSASILDRILDDIDTIPDIDEHIIITNHKFAPIFEDWRVERLQAPLTSHCSQPFSAGSSESGSSPSPLSVPSGFPARNPSPSASPSPLSVSSGFPAQNSSPSASPSPLSVPSGSAARNSSPSAPPSPLSVPSGFPAQNTSPSAPPSPLSVPSGFPARNPSPSASPSPLSVPSGSAARKPITIIDDGTTSNDNRLGAVCDLLQAIEQLSDRKSSNSKWPDDLLVIAGDNLLDFSLAGFIQYGKEKNATCVMRYYEAEEAKLHKTGVAEISDDGRLIAMEEKPAQPKSHWCIPAFYYYTREDTHLIKKGIESGCGIDAPGSLIAWLCGQTPVYSWEMPGKRFDIGSLDTYYQACELAKAGKL